MKSGVSADDEAKTANAKEFGKDHLYLKENTKENGIHMIDSKVDSIKNRVISGQKRLSTFAREACKKFKLYLYGES